MLSHHGPYNWGVKCIALKITNST